MIQSGGAGLGTRSSDVRGQEKADAPPRVESTLALPLPFCPVHAASGLGHAHLHLGRAIFTQPTDSNANLF